MEKKTWTKPKPHIIFLPLLMHINHLISITHAICAAPEAVPQSAPIRLLWPLSESQECASKWAQFPPCYPALDPPGLLLDMFTHLLRFSISQDKISVPSTPTISASCLLSIFDQKFILNSFVSRAFFCSFSWHVLVKLVRSFSDKFSRGNNKQRA